MTTRNWLLLMTLVIAAFPSLLAGSTPAPELFGTSSKVYQITSLADKGTGTLRACVEAKEPRTCRFSVAGIIQLRTNLAANSPHLQILGDTALGPIELHGATLQIRTFDVLIQHLAVRPGDSRSGPNPDARDAIQITQYGHTRPVYDVRLDHISATWAVDENVSIYGVTVRDVQIINSIIAEPLYRSIHSKGPHGMNLLINPGAKNILLQGNLFAHGYDRNPRSKDSTTLQVINNAFYNWGGPSCWNAGLNLSSSSNYKGPLINFVGNLYRPGKSSAKKICPSIYNDSTVPKSTKIFVRDNIGPTRQTSNQDQWLISGLPKTMQASAPLLPLPKDITPVHELVNYLEDNVGPRPWERSQTDARIVAEFLNSSGDIKNCVSGCSRPAK